MRKFAQYVLVSLLALPFTLSAEPLRGITVSSYFSAEDLTDLAPWGPDIVRLPIPYMHDTDSMTRDEYFSLLDSGLTQLDTLLPQFSAAGIKVMLNMYAPPGGFVTRTAPAKHRVFAETWAQEAMIEAWQLITQRYLDNETIYAFDIMNEPADKGAVTGMPRWPELSTTLINTIRAIDADRKIVLESAYGTPAGLTKVYKPGVSGIIYSPHLYYPLNFLHQGHYGRPIKISYPNKKLKKANITKYLRSVVSFQKKYNADIYVGEFTAPRWAPNGSAYRYLSDLIKLMEKRSWSWTYHSFREDNTWSVEHGTDPNSNAKSETLTDRAQLLISYFGLNAP